MNKEDYLIFQKKYVDIWSFISNNVAIYPKQVNNSIEEEMNELYDSNRNLEKYLLDDVIEIKQFENEFDHQITTNVHPNIYECIKSKLINIQPYIYDNKQFIDLTSVDISMIPNRQLIENEMIRKIKEVETKERYDQKVKGLEKKPKLIKSRKSIKHHHSKKLNRTDDLDKMEEYHNSLDEPNMDEDFTDDMDGDDESNFEGDDFEGDNIDDDDGNDELDNDSFTC
jgi:hypothetical protein